MHKGRRQPRPRAEERARARPPKPVYMYVMYRVNMGSVKLTRKLHSQKS